MARTVNPEVHTVKKEAFVEAATRLMQARGWEQTTIQDVLDATEASRGAFYHYFASKQELLVAMVDRIADQALAAVAAVVNDPGLGATAKFRRFFTGIAAYKTEHRALMLELIKVWKSDDNALVRERLRRITLERIAPILAAIIEQGAAEEVFSVDSPRETAQILMTLLTGLQDVATDLFLARQANEISYDQAARTLLGFVGAFERILGGRSGSIQLVDQRTLQEWFG